MNPLDLAKLIRGSNAIALVGAGLSYEAGIPLSRELAPLLWTVTDGDDAIRQALAKRLRVAPASGKALIGDDPRRVQSAYELISKSDAARRRFRDLFADLDADRAKHRSPAHDEITRLLFAGLLEFVISLNWDTLLETAYQRNFGPPINIPKTRLFKPHGDILDLRRPLTLPNEKMAMPSTLVARLQSMKKERPRVLIVVGYSESDEFVIRQVIRPLDAQWRVVRISPKSTSVKDVRGTAASVMKKLSSILLRNNDSADWEFVTFRNQRDLGPAISGERLGPADVEVCPRLPVVTRLETQLEQAHIARLESEPGSGKSISIYQAAHGQMLAGFHVLRLSDSGNEHTALRNFQDSTARSLFIVDDAQRYSHRFLEQLSESAGPGRRLLIAATQHAESNRVVRSIAQESVEAVANAFLTRRQEVLMHVRQHDNRVGDRYMDESIERRIASARKESNLWRFNFVLRAGWSEAGRVIQECKAADRSDLLLVALAALQLANLDAPISIDQLVVVSSHFGRDATWCRAATRELVSHHHVLKDRNRYRVLHLTFAHRLIEHWTSFTAGLVDLKAFGGLLAFACQSGTSLRGVNWLLSAIHFSIPRKLRNRGSLLSGKVVKSLVARCLAASGQEDRQSASYLLGTMLTHSPLTSTLLTPRTDELARWVDESSGIADWSFGALLNSLDTHTNGIAERLARNIDSEALLARLSTVPLKGIDGYAHLVELLHQVAPSSLKRKLTLQLQRAAKLQWRAKIGRLECSHIMSLACAIGHSGLRHARSFIKSGAVKINHRFRESPLGAFDDCQEFVNYFLGWASAILGTRPVSAEQRQIGRMLVRGIRPTRLASLLLSDRPSEWERSSNLLSWLALVDRPKLQDVTRLLDLPTLDSKTQGHWKTPPRELRLLISSLYAGQGRDRRISRWVMSHADEIERVDPLLLLAEPQLGCIAHQRGIPIDLFGHNGRNWHLAALALQQLWRVNRVAARAALDSSKLHLIEAFTNPQPIDYDAGRFMMLACRFNAPVVRQCAADVDWDAARSKWSKFRTLAKARLLCNQIRRLAIQFAIPIPVQRLFSRSHGNR